MKWLSSDIIATVGPLISYSYIFNDASTDCLKDTANQSLSCHGKEHGNHVGQHGSQHSKSTQRLNRNGL